MLTTASDAPHVYIQSDVPEGMTLAAWRRAHTAPRRPRLHRRAARALARQLAPAG